MEYAVCPPKRPRFTDESSDESTDEENEPKRPPIKNSSDALMVAVGDGYLSKMRRIASSVFEPETPARRNELEHAFHTHARVIYGTELYERNVEAINERNGWGTFQERRIRTICVWRRWGKSRLLRALATAFAVVIPNVTVAITGVSLEVSREDVRLAGHEIMARRLLPVSVQCSDPHPTIGRIRYHVSSDDTREILAVVSTSPRIFPSSRSRTRPIVVLVEQVYWMPSSIWHQLLPLFFSTDANAYVNVTAVTDTDLGRSDDEPDDITSDVGNQHTQLMTAWRMRVGASLPAPHLMDVVVYQPTRVFVTPWWTDAPNAAAAIDYP